MLLVEHYIRDKVIGLKQGFKLLDQVYNPEHGTISVKIRRNGVKSDEWVYIGILDLMEYTYVYTRNNRTLSSFGL
jgi:hypothetical protein